MKIPEIAFSATNWAEIPPTRHEGESGFALWHTMNVGEIRIRVVEYSAGYVADHWCDRGHVMCVLEGEVTSELKDGRKFTSKPGAGYVVADFGDSPHRSVTAMGCKLFIVD